jgi:poly(hydroxyalkanoate) granule-associated protein
MATKKQPTITVSKKKTKSSKGKAKKKDFFGLADLPDELAERGREIWLAGLGALSMAEEEGVKLFNTLVSKGEAWEQEGRKQLGAAKDKLDAAREKVASAVGEAASKGSKITELDTLILSKVEDTVEAVLERLGVPTHAEVKDLAGKVEKLSAEVVALAKVMERGKNGAPASKEEPATRKIVYHVVPRGEEWVVKQEGVAEPFSVSATKKEALEAGRTLAKAHMPSRLVTHKQDGTVQESVTYAA